MARSMLHACGALLWFAGIAGAQAEPLPPVAAAPCSLLGTATWTAPAKAAKA